MEPVSLTEDGIVPFKTPLRGELSSERDDVGHVGYPCLIESFSGVSAFPFPCHDLAPVGLEMVENTFDGAVGITEIFFIEFFNVLFFNAVDDALLADVGDHQIPFELSSFLLGR